MSEPRGATAGDWFHWDLVLGLGSNLLPCVPAGEDVRVLAGSALMNKIGKIPSQFNHAGEAHGLLGWQKREIMSNEVAAWSKDRRLNLCIRTGPISGVYAIDVDVEDTETAEQIWQQIQQVLGPVARRVRTNSCKFLVPFRLEEE